MKKIIHKALSILLIPVLLFSTTSFSVFVHECDNQIFSLSLLENNESCDMEINTATVSCEIHSETHNTMQFVSNDDFCCSSNSELHQGNIVHLEKLVKIPNIPSKLIAIPAFLYNDFAHVNHKAATNFKYYSPPIRVKNISILYQVFQI